jgi:hypothetical protein
MIDQAFHFGYAIPQEFWSSQPVSCKELEKDPGLTIDDGGMLLLQGSGRKG